MKNTADIKTNQKKRMHLNKKGKFLDAVLLICIMSASIAFNSAFYQVDASDGTASLQIGDIIAAEKTKELKKNEVAVISEKGSISMAAAAVNNTEGITLEDGTNIKSEQIVGKAVFRIWPLNRAGFIQ